MIITSVSAILALLLSASLWIRFRILTAAIVTARAVPITHAEGRIRLSYFTTKPSAVPDIVTDSSPASDNYWPQFPCLSVLVSAAVVLLLLAAVYVWFFLYNRRSCANWTFCLNIGNGDESLIVPIQRMPNNPYYYHFVATSFIQSMALKKNCCTYWLNINWPSLSMVYWPNDTVIHLKKRTCLPAWQGRILNRIMRSEYWCLPVGTMAGRLFYLALQHANSDMLPHHSVLMGNKTQSLTLDPSAPTIPLATLYPSLSSPNSDETHETSM